MAAAWEEYLDKHEDQHLTDLFEFLRIPSVSTLPEHQDDMRRAAHEVVERLRAAGVPEVEILETGGHPLVFGSWHVDDNQPTALIYGHYDVQPPDPLDLWQSGPFQPEIRDGRIYARGASDDKGNIFAAMLGVEALHATAGKPPINVKFFIEGEEEVGSHSLPGFVHDNRERFACDFVICADGGMYGENQPSLTLSSKGLAGCQINLRTAATDMHSGMFGAVIPNALEAMARLADSFHTPDGRIAVEGFYDDVVDLSDEERAETARVPFDEQEFLNSVGAKAFWGEPGYTPLERMGARPTLDFNGLWGGFEGEGNKTVTPAEAHLKISCRLVPNQEPGKIVGLIRKHAETHCPEGATIAFGDTAGGALPFAIQPDHPALVKAGEVLEQIYGTKPLALRMGGTLPVAPVFQRELGADMVFFAFGMPGDNAHAPNESMVLDAWRTMSRAYCAYLEALAR